MDDLRCDYLVNPLGIDARAPALELEAAAVRPDSRSLAQSAYQVAGRSHGGAACMEDKGALWDSGQGRVGPVAARGLRAASRWRRTQACWWKVRVWDQDGKVSAWSAPARWSMGMLNARATGQADGSAGIGGEERRAVQRVADRRLDLVSREASRPIGAPIGTRYFRRSFALPEGRRVRKASHCWRRPTIHLSRSSMAGQVGGGQAGPRSSYFDVTAPAPPGHQHARDRRHEFAVAQPSGRTKTRRGLIGMLKVEFDDGEPLLVSTDARWRTSDQDGAEVGSKPASTMPAGRRPRIRAVWASAPWGKIGGSNHRRLPSRMLRHEFKVAEGPSAGRPPTSAASASSTCTSTAS